MQQGTREFHPAFLSARQRAHFFGGAIEKIDAGKLFLDSRRGGSAGHAMQGGMVIQVLRDGEIEIQRGLLKHHAKKAQSCQRVAFGIVAIDGDFAETGAVEPGDQGKQRGFPCAVETEQNRKIARLHGEGYIVQYLALAEGVAEAGNREGGRWIRGQ